MKKYVFEITYEVVEEVVVEADDYEEAEVKLEEGRGEILSEDKYDWDFTCTKMPDENEGEYVNEDKYQSIQSDNADYFVQEKA